MASSTLSLLFSLLFICIAAGITAAAVVPPFIKSSCSATTYPDLCVRDLSAYAATVNNNPEQLVETALGISKSRTQSAQGYLKKLKHFKGLHQIAYKAIIDCLEEVSDSLERLTNSAQEMKGMGRAKGQSFAWHMCNVQTWVSAALTDENTCSDGFAGRTTDPKIKSSVRAQIVSVAQATSNALALINNFAKKH